MGQLNKIGRGLRPRSTMTLRFLQARLKHYIICWDQLNSCYSEEFTKLIGCCRFNWRRIQSWHTKRGNIIDKVNSRGRYKKRVKMISSLCQNNPAGRRGEAERIEQKQSFVQLREEQARGGRVILSYFDKMTSAFFSSRFTRQTASVCTSKTLTSTKRT